MHPFIEPARGLIALPHIASQVSKGCEFARDRLAAVRMSRLPACIYLRHFRHVRSQSDLCCFTIAASRVNEAIGKWIPAVCRNPRTVVARCRKAELIEGTSNAGCCLIPASQEKRRLSGRCHQVFKKTQDRCVLVLGAIYTRCKPRRNEYHWNSWAEQGEIEFRTDSVIAPIRDISLDRLHRRRRRDMIVDAAILVESDDQQRLVPFWAGAEGVIDGGEIVLSRLNI